MHPAHARAKQVMALVETAESVASLRVQMDRIEVQQAEILALLKAAPDALKPPRKDK